MIKLTKFLICIDAKSKQLYILHRERPAALILVEKDKMPTNFVVLDLFDDTPKDEAIKFFTNKEFKKELHEFFESQTFNLSDLN
jgi:hypothetical protein